METNIATFENTRGKKLKGTVRSTLSAESLFFVSTLSSGLDCLQALKTITGTEISFQFNIYRLAMTDID